MAEHLKCFKYISPCNSLAEISEKQRSRFGFRAARPRPCAIKRGYKDLCNIDENKWFTVGAISRVRRYHSPVEYLPDSWDVKPATRQNFFVDDDWSCLNEIRGATRVEGNTGIQWGYIIPTTQTHHSTLWRLSKRSRLRKILRKQGQSPKIRQIRRCCVFPNLSRFRDKFRQPSRGALIGSRRRIPTCALQPRERRLFAARKM